MEDVASRPNETFIYKVQLTMATLKLHCAIVTFHFKRGDAARRTPLCKLDNDCYGKGDSLVVLYEALLACLHNESECLLKSWGCTNTALN